MDQDTLDKINEIHNNIQEIKKDIQEIKKDIKEIKKSTTNMDEHIGFINRAYDKYNGVLSFINGKFQYLMYNKKDNNNDNELEN